MKATRIQQHLQRASQALAMTSINERTEPVVDVVSKLAVEPFWLCTDELAQAVEGKYYLQYIRAHPSFRLVVRQSVLERLQVAQKSLPGHWQLIVKAGFRPLAVQQAMFNDFLIQVSREHIDWSAAACRAYAGRYIIDPASGVAPHVTGGAVDIDVLDTTTGKLADMGCKVGTLGEIAHCLSPQLTDVQRGHQTLLLETMTAAGFAPLYSEWWHFSYGDQRWAAFYGKDHAIYGVIKQETSTMLTNETTKE